LILPHYKYKDGRTNKFIWGRKALFVSLFLSLLITIGLTIYDDRENARKEEESKLQYDNLSKQQQETINNITGKDSYCFLMLTMKADIIAELKLVNAGKYPMSDVVINIVDSNKLSDSPTIEEIQAQTKTALFSNLTPRIVYPVGDLIFSNNEKVKYIAHIYHKYGTFTQFLKIEKVNGEWKQATKVEKTFPQEEGGSFPPPEKVYYYIDPAYPTNAKGEVEW